MPNFCIDLAADLSELRLSDFLRFAITFSGAAVEAVLLATVNRLPFAARRLPIELWRSGHGKSSGPLPGPLKCHFQCYSGPPPPANPVNHAALRSTATLTSWRSQIRILYRPSPAPASHGHPRHRIEMTSISEVFGPCRRASFATDPRGFGSRIANVRLFASTSSPNLCDAILPPHEQLGHRRDRDRSSQSRSRLGVVGTLLRDVGLFFEASR